MRGARYRLGSRPQHQGRHASLPSGKREPSRRGEVEGRGFADRLDDYRADRAASRDVGPGPENGNAIRGIDQDQGIGRDPQFDQAMSIGPSIDAGAGLLPHPKDRPSLPGTPSQEQREGRGARCIGGGAGINLMQRCSDESAAQSRIQRFRTKRNLRAVDPIGLPARLKPGSHKRLGG